jgi:hypothetical protein
MLPTLPDRVDSIRKSRYSSVSVDRTLLCHFAPGLVPLHAVDTRSRSLPPRHLATLYVLRQAPPHVSTLPYVPSSTHRSRDVDPTTSQFVGAIPDLRHRGVPVSGGLIDLVEGFAEVVG